MEPIFYTYQEFYTHTKGVTYILIVASLICIAFFCRYLEGKDKDKNGKDF